MIIWIIIAIVAISIIASICEWFSDFFALALDGVFSGLLLKFTMTAIIISLACILVNKLILPNIYLVYIAKYGFICAVVLVVIKIIFGIFGKE